MFISDHGWIYMLIHKGCDIIKIGSTKQIDIRISNYKTYNHDLDDSTHELYVFEILNDDITCYNIDKLIQESSKRYSNPYVKYDGTGGIEYYEFTTIDHLKNFFNLIDIKYNFSQIMIADLDLTNENHDLTKKEIKKVNNTQVDELQHYFDMIENHMINKAIEILTPRDYQQEAIDASILHLKTNKKGKVIIPCGGGKSLVMFEIIKNININKILVLVPSLLLLNQIGEMFDRMIKQYNSDIKMCFIGSEQTTQLNKYKLFSKSNPGTINEYHQQHQHLIMISTYQSCAILKDLQFDLIMFDEAHKTAVTHAKNEDEYDNYSGFNYYVSQYDDNNTKKIFFTATEKFIKMNDDNNDDLQIVSMDNENLYGKTIFNMSTLDAINKGALSDYLIKINNKCVEEYLTKSQIKMIQKKYKFDCCVEYYAKAILLLEFIEEFDITHIITKHSTIKKTKYFERILSDLTNENDVNISTIDGNMSMSKRNVITNGFKQSKVSILCSAKCMNEGVNIPIIDCVVPVDNMESSIDIVQFVGRAFRKHPNKKISYVFIPMLISEGTDIVNFKSDYNNVRVLLRALSHQDSRIVQWFNEYSAPHNDNAKKRLNNIIEFSTDGTNKFELDIKMKLVKDFNKCAPESFDKAKEFVKSLKFITKNEYHEWCDNRESHFNIPKNADGVYKTLGWITWSDYLSASNADKKDIEIRVQKHNKNLKNKITDINEHIKYLLVNDGDLTLNEIKQKLKNNDFIVKNINDKHMSSIKNILIYDKNTYSINDSEMKYIDINAIHKYDKFARHYKLPSMDELTELFGNIDTNKFFGIEMNKFLKWTNLCKLARSFYAEHKNIDRMGGYYYDELIKKHQNIPKDPTSYKEFTNFNTLFGIQNED